MSDIKLKVTKKGSETGFYAQGEYKADLTNATVTAHPTFARHLVALGFAEGEEVQADTKESLMKNKKDVLQRMASDRGLTFETDANKERLVEILLTGKSADLPDFVQRETTESILVSNQSVGEVAPVPTEELTVKEGTGVLSTGDKK